MKTLNRINPIGDTLHRLARAGSTVRIASTLAALALASTAAHAAPTVWNVNIGTELTTGDSFTGAAPENNGTKFWNSVTIANPSAMALNDSENNATTATLTLTGSLQFTNGGWAGVSGPEIFTQWSKSSDNATPFGMVIGGLSSSDTYDLIVYSDWFWKGNATLPVTQTVGTGLVGTVVLDQISTGSNGAVPGLVQDTDLGPNGATEGNWLRITGLTPDGSGNLGFSMGGTNAAFNGFQLVKVDLGDATPPTPDPMTWDSAPAATGETSIAMTATTASDPSGVEYSFTETSGNPGATNSGWQDSPVHTDTGLTPGTTYTYTVTARDKSIAQNAGTASASASASTLAEDLIAPTPDPMSFDTLPAASSITTITMTATTASDANGVEYYFTETSGNSGGSNSGWQDSPVYTDGGLNPGTSYTYKVKARDKAIAQNPTTDSTTASATTDPETVVSSVWNVNIGNEITTGDNFAGAAPENTVPNSFWNSVTTANPSGLALADSATSTSAGVTLTLAGSIGYADFATITGPEIFSTWIKSTDNATPYNMVIGGLSFSKTYDLVVYSDWFWKGNGTLPLTLTAGTGLASTVVLDQISTGTNGIVPGLILDTDPLPNMAIQGNWIRISGLTPDINGNLGFSMGGTNAAFNGFQLVYPAGVVSSGFTTWADANNASGQTPAQDHDNDGVENGIEYFMGQTGSSFTAMPGLDGTNTVTWPMAPTYAGTYEVQTSPDLGTWTNVDPKPLPAGGNLSYTLPTGLGKQFVRLLVTPTP